MDKKFRTFLEIAETLNKHHIVPIIYGSLGLYRIIEQLDEINDIDITISDKNLIDKFTELKEIMDSIEYKQDPNYMHEFTKGEGQIGFEPESELADLGIDIDNLKIAEINGVRFKELSVQDYLKIYSRNLATWEKKVSSIKKKIEALKTKI
ncbi:MAG: hypothetical protein AAB641_01710 [Patescibacteria group bacterium]